MQKKYALILLVWILAVTSTAGMLEVTSDPLGAEIIINHIRTGRYTPDTLRNLPEKELKVSVLLDEYKYEERLVVPGIDSVVSVSFSRLSDFDTLAITGDSLFGILQLPKPPVETPYLVNEIIEDRENVILSTGIHRIEWDGGISFVPIDTFIEILPGRIATVELNFERRYGRVSIVTVPDSALIQFDTSLVGLGVVRKPLAAGKHELKVSSPGWISANKTIVLFPGQTYRDTIELEPTPDRDGDGFHDTVDICPELHGIYDGCPSIQKREEFRRIGSHLGRSFWAAPFTIEFAPFSIQSRYATDKPFRELISVFNDGPALLNNYSGVTLFNKLWISRGLFIGSIDGGFSFAGLKYEKQWHLPLNSDSSQLLIYDRYSDINPEMEIFSLGFQAGIQLQGDVMNFAVLTGYLYETIEIYGVTEIDENGDSSLVSIKEDYSGWNTTIRSTVSIRNEPLWPRIYGEMSFVPGKDNPTGWIDLRLGVIVPWWKKR